MSVSKENLLEAAYKYTPSLYALKHYTIRGNPITFHIPKREDKLVRMHRPWQRAILDDRHPNKVVRKSRQLGLSEIEVIEGTWFADVHERINLMLTFP